MEQLICMINQFYGNKQSYICNSYTQGIIVDKDKPNYTALTTLHVLREYKTLHCNGTVYCLFFKQREQIKIILKSYNLLYRYRNRFSIK